MHKNIRCQVLIRVALTALNGINCFTLPLIMVSKVAFPLVRITPYGDSSNYNISLCLQIIANKGRVIQRQIAINKKQPVTLCLRYKEVSNSRTTYVLFPDNIADMG